MSNINISKINRGVGKKKPIVFLVIKNETKFFVDRSKCIITRYSVNKSVRKILKAFSNHYRSEGHLLEGSKLLYKCHIPITMLENFF